MAVPDLKEIANKFETELKVPIYQFDVGAYSFLFRPLTLAELELANTRTDYAELEDFYVESVTVYPENFNLNKIKAGYITRYADEILRISGFDDLDVITEMMEQYRKRSENNVIFMMKSYIITAIPAYKDTDFDDFTMEQLIEKLVLAESIIGIQQGISGMEPTGFKLVLTALDQEPEPEQVPLPKQRLNMFGETVIIPPKKTGQVPQPEKKLSDDEYMEQKRQLIAMLKHQDATELMRADSTHQVPDYKALEDLPVESLQNLIGVTKVNDPIAEKLNANRARERSVAQDIGIPYKE